jgi:hypothetical protein
MVKVVELEPAGTVTVAGNVAFPVLEVIVTAKPPVGATALRVMVPVELEGAVTVVGLSVRVVTPTWVRVRTAVLEAPLAVAVMVVLLLVVPAPTVTVKVVEVDPAGTVTVAGTVAAELLDANVTTTPPVGATAERVTVPIDVEL